jgi:hypothetical protein
MYWLSRPVAPEIEGFAAPGIAGAAHARASDHCLGERSADGQLRSESVFRTLPIVVVFGVDQCDSAVTFTVS